MKKIFINLITAAISALCFLSCSQEPYDWSQEGPTVIEEVKNSTPLIEKKSIKIETFINVTAGAKISKVKYTLLDITQTIIEEKEGTPVEDKNGYFTVEFTGLEAGTIYTIQLNAYSSSSSEPVYSEGFNVKTASDFTLTTGDANSITQTSAKVYGEFNSEVIKPSAEALGIVFGINNDLQTGNYDIVPYTSIDGNFFTVELTGLEAARKYYYCTCFLRDGIKYYGDIREFTTKGYEISNEQVVDLGLSVNWAGYNIGAQKPEEYGEYYAWGEAEKKESYTENNYTYYENGYTSIGNEISGTKYDVATQKWGKKWRMPTLEEFQELIEKCTWEAMTYNGIQGRKIIGPNGNCIFIPLAGLYKDTKISSLQYDGYYWLGTYSSESDFHAASMNIHGYFNSPGTLLYEYRYYGLTIRAVSDK